jgi:hypothetical protein
MVEHPDLQERKDEVKEQIIRALVNHWSPPSILVVRRMMTRPMANRVRVRVMAVAIAIATTG